MRANQKLLLVFSTIVLLLPLLVNGFSAIPSNPRTTTALLPAPTLPPRILFFTQFADNDPFLGETYSVWDAVNDTHGTNYIWTNLSSYNDLTTELPDHDILLIPEQEQMYEENLTDVATAWQTPLNTFLSQGGIVIVMSFFSPNFGPIPAALILNETGLMSIQGETFSTGSSVSILDATDPLADGVGSFTAPEGSRSFTTTETGIVANTSAGPIVLHKLVGPGHVVLMGMDFFSRNAEADKILGNAIRLYQPPAAPILSDPGATISGFEVPLNWTVPADTDGIIVEYEVQASSSATFTIIGQTATVTTNTHAFTFLSNGTYYFRVRAIDNNTLVGPWSNVVSTYIELPPITFPEIPGFPLEAIAIGLLLCLGAVFVIRRRKQQQVSS